MKSDEEYDLCVRDDECDTQEQNKQNLQLAMWKNKSPVFSVFFNACLKNAAYTLIYVWKWYKSHVHLKYFYQQRWLANSHRKPCAAWRYTSWWRLQVVVFFQCGEHTNFSLWITKLHNCHQSTGRCLTLSLAGREAVFWGKVHWSLSREGCCDYFSTQKHSVS